MYARDSQGRLGPSLKNHSSHHTATHPRICPELRREHDFLGGGGATDQGAEEANSVLALLGL